MLPVIYRFVFDTPLSRTLLGLLGVGVVAYLVFSGWRNAGTVDSSGAVIEPTREERIRRAISHGVFGLVLVGFGLYYMLPEVPLLGIRGKAEGFPFHTYGILVAAGFVCAVTVSAWLAVREWPGKLGVTRRDQVFDLAFYVFVGAIAGSRDLFVLVNWSSYVGERSSIAKAAEGYATLFDLIVLVGLILAVLLRERLFADRAFRERLITSAFRYFIIAFVGGRVLLVFARGGGFGQLVDMLSGGLVFYGGLIGAAVTALWYATAHGIEFLRLADIAMPTVSLGQALGRLGCFAAGCCWGGATTHAKAPFAVEFPGSASVKDLFGNVGSNASIAYSEMVTDQRYLVEATGEVLKEAAPVAERIADWVARHGHTYPVHPTQLYESFGQTILFIALLTLRRFRRFHGQIFGTWLICYPLLRSTIELFRGDLARGTFHDFLALIGLSGAAEAFPLGAWYNFSIAQFISACLLPLGVWVLVKGLRAARAQPAVDLQTLTAP